MNESFIVVLISLVLVKYNDVIFFLQVTFFSWFKFNFSALSGLSAKVGYFHSH